MAAEWTVVVVGRSPEKMRAASAVLEASGFAVVGVFTAADALHAVAEHHTLLAVVAGGSVLAAVRERLRVAADARGVMVVDASIGHSDPAAHFESVVLPRLREARAARAASS